MKRKYKYLEALDAPKTTRERSYKQESRIAKELKGRTTINSGATFGQNDVYTDYCEVEAKTTQQKSYSLKLTDWYKLKRKCSPAKLPLMVVDFEESGDSLAVLSFEDLKFLIEQANKE